MLPVFIIIIIIIVVVVDDLVVVVVFKNYLTFITLWANSADDKFMIFSCFPRKQDLTFHANCLHWRQFA